MGNNNSGQKLLKEDIDFLVQNTNFCKSEIKQWYKGFMVGFRFTITVSVFVSGFTNKLFLEIFLSTLPLV